MTTIHRGARTCGADTGEIAPALSLLHVNAARVVPTGLGPAGIELFTEGADVLIVALAGKSCLKHKRTEHVMGVLENPSLGWKTRNSKAPLLFIVIPTPTIFNGLTYIMT